MIRLEHAFLLALAVAAVTVIVAFIADRHLRRENRSLRHKLHELADALRKFGDGE